MSRGFSLSRPRRVNAPQDTATLLKHTESSGLHASSLREWRTTKQMDPTASPAPSAPLCQLPERGEAPCVLRSSYAYSDVLCAPPSSIEPPVKWSHPSPWLAWIVGSQAHTSVSLRRNSILQDVADSSLKRDVHGPMRHGFTSRRVLVRRKETWRDEQWKREWEGAGERVPQRSGEWCDNERG